MLLHSITLTNFGCMAELTFPFPENNGLYLITGKNLHQPSLGSNAVGKSTIIAALVWCLYGKTPKLERGKCLLNNKQTGGYSVSLQFTTDIPHTLIRTWSPNSIKLDDLEVDQDTITKLIGTTFEQFLYSVCFPQKGTNFLDLTSTEKLNFLSDLFELDKWVKAVEMCKTELTTLNTELERSQLRNELRVMDITPVKESIQSLTTKQDEWELNRTLELVALNTEIKHLNHPVMEAVVATPTIEVKEADIIADLNHLKREIQVIQNKVRDLTSRRAVNHSRLTNVQQELAKLLPKICPTCKQTMSIVEYEKFEAELTSQEKLRKDGDEILARQLDCQVEALHKLEERQSTIQELLGLLKEASHESALAEEQQKRYETLQLQAEKLKEATNPYQEQLEGLKAKLEGLERGLGAHLKQNAELSKQISQYEYWKGAFPRIRLQVLDSLTTELEIYFNAAFGQIGLPWELRLSTVRELADESLKPELTLTLFQDGEEMSIPGMSGGEYQRLKLIVTLGLAELIKARKGTNLNLLVFDEPLSSLSDVGIEAMLNLFQEIGQSQVVLLVEHLVLSKTNFSGIFEIIKNTDGYSSINVN